ncbi:DUF1428 family protein [Virgibacillus sp. FSP13]
MYTVIKIYRVNKIHKQQFLDINERASEIYLANGALEDTTYLADNLNGQQGYMGLLDIINVADDELVFFGQSVYRNKSHFEDVRNHVNDEKELDQLYDELTKIVDFSRIVNASFTTEDKK